MINEIIFISHAIIIACCALVALRLGSQALVAFISVQCILANLFVVKQIDFYGFTVTSSDAFTIGAVLGLNLLQEYYGRNEAKKAIWISFGLLVFYGIMTHIHLSYAPSVCDTMHHAYAAILGFMPRIIIASLAVYLFVQHFDSWLYAQLKRICAGNYLVGRNYISLSCSQFLDTVLFSFLGLYGIVENIWHIIFISYIIKMAAITIATPVFALASFVWLRPDKEENL